MLGAAYVTTALKDAKLAAAAGPVFQDLYYTQYERFHEMAKLFYSSNRTTESYFWEARRILGESGEAYTPRQDFIRAVAGQPPQGYERAVLAQGELPGGFVEGVRRVERELASREARITAGGDALLQAVPRLAPDATICQPASARLGRVRVGMGLSPRRPVRKGWSAAGSSPICCGGSTGGARSISWSGRSAPATRPTPGPKSRKMCSSPCVPCMWKAPSMTSLACSPAGRLTRRQRDRHTSEGRTSMLFRPPAMPVPVDVVCPFCGVLLLAKGEIAHITLRGLHEDSARVGSAHVHLRRLRAPRADWLHAGQQFRDLT